MNCLPSWSTEESSNWVMFPSFPLFSLQPQSHDNPVDRGGETFVSRANLIRGNSPHTTWTVTMDTLTQFISSVIMFTLHSVHVHACVWYIPASLQDKKWTVLGGCGILDLPVHEFRHAELHHSAALYLHPCVLSGGYLILSLSLEKKTLPDFLLE